MILSLTKASLIYEVIDNFHYKKPLNKKLYVIIEITPRI